MDSGAVLLTMLEVFSSGDLSNVDSIVSPDYIDHQEASDMRGSALFTHIVTRVRERFPDLRATVDDLIAEQGKAVARVSWTGTDVNRTPFRAEGIDIIRIVDGKAIEH